MSGREANRGEQPAAPAGVQSPQLTKGSAMKSRMLLPILLAACAAASLAWRGQETGQETGTEAPPVLTPVQQVESLAWLTGHWRGKSGTNDYETVYTSATGGQIAGASKEFNAKRIVMFDFELIFARGNDVFLVPWPYGKRSKQFRLLGYDPRKKRARFENLEHDFPKVFVYSIEKDGRLKIHLAGEMGGKEAKFDIVMRKVR